MKKLTTIALVVLTSLVMVGSLSAQDREVQATVPFDFTVGTKLLPAGTYTIYSEIDNHNAIVIQNKEKNVVMLSPANAADNESKSADLVFHKYGDQYFLSEILNSSAEMNLKIPTSRMENRARLQEQSKLQGSDQVLVALK